MSAGNGQAPPFGALEHLEVQLEVDECGYAHVQVWAHAAGRRAKVVEMSAEDCGVETRVVNPPPAPAGALGAWT